MALEIERKFLVHPARLPQFETGSEIIQGYMAANSSHNLRIRIASDIGYLTIKSRTAGAVRTEFEYEIPLSDAQEMLIELCQPPFIHKTRYLVPHDRHTWEVDVFSGNNRGLILAEVELESADEKIQLPDWIKTEVTDEERYSNSNLASHPFNSW